MAKNQARIGFGIDFNVNQQSLNNVKKALGDLKKMSKEEIEKSGGNIIGLSDSKTKSWKNDLGAMRKELGALEKAFEAAYNPKLGTYELNKFNASLKESGTSAQQAFSAVAAYGQQGQAALLDMTTNMLAVDRAAKQVNSTMKKLGDTMMNTIRWTITSTAINTVTGAIQQAYHYALDLDRSLNDIRIVTDKSADDMNKFAREANKAAKALGASTTDYTEASLIYYQQGLSDKDVKARTDTTIKTAAVTGQSASAVSEQLTAVWNGYKVSAEESEIYIDKLAAVAASTAADLEELSTGMSKVASAANVMGVDIDQLNAQLATIVSVTREAPESIGTALKTVYARMSDIEAGLDTETTLGEYTSQMAQMGINVLDANGKLRDMGVVVEEIGNKWTTLNREQQVSLAQSIAGTRQYSRMMALFDNWDMYQDAMTTSMESAGTLAKQHATYLESIEAHQERLNASAEGLYDSIFDSDEIKKVYDLLSGIVTVVDQLVQTLGGMPGILALAGMLFTKIAKSQIGDLVIQREKNKLAKEANEIQVKRGLENIQALQKLKGLSAENEKILSLEKELYEMAGDLNDEEWARAQAIIRKTNEGIQEEIRLTEQLNETKAKRELIEKGEARIQVEGTSRKERLYYMDPNKEADDTHGSFEDLKNDTEELRKKIADKENKLAAGQYKDPKRMQVELENDKKQLALMEEQVEAGNHYSTTKKGIIKLEQQHTKALENQRNINQQNKQDQDMLKKEADLRKQSQAWADLTGAIATANFGMTMIGASVNNIADAFASADFNTQSFLQGLGGIATSAVSLVKGFKDTSKALKAVKASTDAGAFSWTSFWAAATMGLSLVITGVTTVLEIITSVVDAIDERRKEAIEDANTAIEEAKANQKLADSYLELYEAYKESGEITEELRNSAQALIDKYNLQSYTIDLLCGKYDQLAEEARKAREEEQKTIDTNNAIKRDNAKKQLNKNIKGVSESTYIDSSGKEVRSLGFEVNIEKEEEAKALALVKEAAETAGAAVSESVNKDSIAFLPENTPEGLTNLYNALNKVYAELPDSKIKRKVKKMLESENFASGAANYSEAILDLARSQASKAISAKNYDANRGTSEQFQKDRNTLIQDFIATGIMNEEEARNAVDALYAEQGGAAYQMSLREQFLEKLQRDGIKDTAKIEALRSEYNNLSNADFSSLMSIPLKDFSEKSIKEIVEDAKDKALQLQEQAWADARDARLANLERQAAKQSGQAKVNILREELEIYENVLEVQKATANETKENFFNLLEEKGLLEALDAEALLAEGNFEELQNRIHMLGDQNSDVSAELQSELLKVLQATNKISDAEQDAADARLAHFNSLFETSDLQLEYLDNANSLLEKQISLYRLVKGESALLDTTMTKAMGNISSANLELTFTQLNLALKALNEFEGDLNSEEGQDYISKTMATFEAYGDMLLSAAEKAGDIYANTIQALFDDFEKNGLRSLKTFKQISSEWDWTQEHEADYLDSVESEFAKQNLSYAFKEAIEKNKNIGSQKKINDLLQRELDALKEKDKLTQVDFDRAQARLSVLQAQIALEEAQANKTQMRLVRGPGGAYSYQYVADESAVNEAEKNLTDANNEVYTTSKENLTSSIDEWKTLYQEWQDEIVAAKDKGASEEELKEINRRYQEELETRAKLIQKQGEEWQRTMELIGMSSEEADKVVNSSIGSFIKGFANAETDLSSLAGKITNAYSNYKTEVEGYLTTINGLLKEQKTLIDKLIEALNSMGSTNPVVSEYEPPVLSPGLDNASKTDTKDPPGTIYAGGSVFTPTNQEIHWDSDWETGRGQKWLQAQTSTNYPGESLSYDIGDGEAHGSSQWTFNLLPEERMIYTGPYGQKYVKVAAFDDHNYIRMMPLQYIMTKGTSARPFSSYDTGGYTGDWNSSDGRLAMLHQKEIVLNKDDTSNFLQALDILRSLNLSMLNSIAGMNSFYNNANTNWTNANTNISQTVEIKAEFPNVTDRNEIEEAFDNLVNLAAQHAFKNTHA